MNVRILNIAALLIGMHLTPSCLGQDVAMKRLPGFRSAIFADDFSAEIAGKFPSRWEGHGIIRASTVGVDNIPCYAVAKTGQASQLVMQCKAAISPAIPDFTVLGDTFSIEFDYFTYPTTSIIIRFFEPGKTNYAHDNDIDLGLSDSGFAQYSTWWQDQYFESHANYPGTFNFSKWHHYLFRYCHGSVVLVVDGKTVLEIPSCHCTTPQNMSFLLINSGAISYANFNISTGVSMHSFDDLLEKRPLTLHEIGFDAGKNSITPNGKAFLDDLVTWLGTHPTAKLQMEVYGPGTEQIDKYLKKRKVKPEAIVFKTMELPVLPVQSPEEKINSKKVVLQQIQ